MPASRLWAFHASPGAFQRLAPPWQSLRIRSWSGGIQEGGRLVFQINAAPGLWITWDALHTGYIEGRQFSDRQLRGPFADWFHTHACLPHPADPARSILHDSIHYRLPLGPLGALLGGRKLRADLDRMFAFRHRRTAIDCQRHHQFAHFGRIRVALSGSTGLLGSALVPFLLNGGHTVDRFVRPATSLPPDGLDTGRIDWDLRARLDPARLEGLDAVVHLAGAPIASRWNKARKAMIRDSRVGSTWRLAEALAQLRRPPRVLLVASGVNIYHPSGLPVAEDGPLGRGFLADVARDWEAAAEPARKAGVRVVHLRLGVVLGAKGGMLARLRPLFNAGLGATLGDGRQILPWVALEDAVGAIHHALFDATLAGPLNITAPHPASNADFARALAHTLRRPLLLRAPPALLHAAAGELAATMLESQHILPARLQQAGFHFHLPTLADALGYELGVRQEAAGIGQ